MNKNALLGSRIDEYITSHGLGHGSTLSFREMAVEFGCEEDALIRALRTAERNRKLTYDEKKGLARLADYHDRFSFTKSAAARKRNLRTEVIEKEMRLPTVDEDSPFFELERRAQEALGLTKRKKLLLISRVRLLEGRPSVFQRAYLDPARFPKNFLAVHDFEKESLIDTYSLHGYVLISRDTTLLARFPNLYETNTLSQRFHSEPWDIPVLDAEQKLYAQDPKDKKKRFVIEFLKASYFENWKYEIKDRPFS